HSHFSSGSRDERIRKKIHGSLSLRASMPRPLGMLVLAALLAAPLSVASSSAHADFQTKGIIELPAESRADFHPFAFYLGQTSDVTGTLRTPELRVTLFERHDVYVEAGLTFIKTQKEPVKSRSFTLHNASASFSPGAGLLGLYPGSDGEMHVEPSEAWTAEPSPFSSLP